MGRNHCTLGVLAAPNTPQIPPIIDQLLAFSADESEAGRGCLGSECFERQVLPPTNRELLCCPTVFCGREFGFVVFFPHGVGLARKGIRVSEHLQHRLGPWESGTVSDISESQLPDRQWWDSSQKQFLSQTSDYRLTPRTPRKQSCD